MHPLVITLTGAYDIYRQPELRRALEPASDAETLVVDLSQVEYLDSTALGVLAGMRTVRRKNELPPAHLIVVSEQIRRVLAVTGLDRIWTIHRTLEEAVETAGAR